MMEQFKKIREYIGERPVLTAIVALGIVTGANYMLNKHTFPNYTPKNNLSGEAILAENPLDRMRSIYQTQTRM